MSDSSHHPHLPHIHIPLRGRRLMILLIVAALASISGILWHHPRDVQLTVDGMTRQVYPVARTVGELLAEEHIKLGAEDFVTPPFDTRLKRHTAVKITRVTHRRDTLTTSTAPKVTWSSRTRANLRRVLVQKGFSKEDIQVVVRTLYDGAVVSEKVIKRQKKTHPFFTLTLLDTKTDRPLRTYDLLKAPALKMLATAYYVGDPMVPSDTTYGGHKLQRGLVAVDPTVIPLGTRLYIPGYGYSYADDTGSAIKGMRIDLAVKDAKEEVRYNHRRVTIYLLGKSKTW